MFNAVISCLKYCSCDQQIALKAVNIFGGLLQYGDKIFLVCSKCDTFPRNVQGYFTLK